MSYYILTTKDEIKQSGETAALEVVKERIKEGLYSIPESSPGFGKVTGGDAVIFYASGRGNVRYPGFEY